MVAWRDLFVRRCACARVLEPEHSAGRVVTVSVRAVYSGYCNSATAPTLANANTPTPVTYLNGNTYYTCDQGYESSLVAGAAPYYTCTLGSAAQGIWLASSGTCTRAPPLSLSSSRITYVTGCDGMTSSERHAAHRARRDRGLLHGHRADARERQHAHRRHHR